MALLKGNFVYGTFPLPQVLYVYHEKIINYKYSLCDRFRELSKEDVFCGLQYFSYVTFYFAWRCVSTFTGYPYEDVLKRFSWKRSIVSCPFPRASIHFFNQKNRVNSHNQSRHDGLYPEKLWLKTNTWFRIITALLSIIVVDFWQAHFYHFTPRIKRN